MFESFVIENSSENPTFVLIVYTVLFCFLLSALLAITYEKTSQGKSNPVNFLQSLILVSIVTATVMQAIGDSVARGLGMLGALSIIRFRTTLKDQRNLIFIFASIAVGIACGIYAFVIAVVGTVGFCISAFILRFSPYKKTNQVEGTLKFEVHDKTRIGIIEKLIKANCNHSVVKKYRVIRTPDMLNKIIEYEYSIQMKEKEKWIDLIDKLSEINGIEGVRFNMQEYSEDN